MILVSLYLISCKDYLKLSSEDVKSEWFYEYVVTKKSDTVYFGPFLQKELHQKTINGKYHIVKNGSIVEKSDYTNHLLHGNSIRYYPNSQIMQQGYYSKGKRNGVFVFFYENGNIKTISCYNNNENVGEWIYYDEYGKVIKTEKYK